MKKNNKKPSRAKPRVTGKAKLLAVLMFLQAVLANAVEGVVLRTISSPTESRVMLDTTNDGQADMYISIPLNIEPRAHYEFIRSFFARGSTVEIDDDYVLHDGNIPFAYLGGVLAIDRISPMDTIRDGSIFEAAFERKQAEYRQHLQNQAQRGGR